MSRTRKVEAGDLTPDSTKSRKKRATSSDKPSRKAARRTRKTETPSVDEKPGKRRRRSRKSAREARKEALNRVDVNDDEVVEEDEAGAELENQFEEALEVVERMPSVFEQENEQLSQYRHMFTKLKKMIRIAEKKYMDSHQSRDMYAVLKAYDQMREMIADLRALADYTQHVETLKVDVIDPFTQSVAAALIEYHKGVDKYLQQNMSSADFRLANQKLKHLASEAGVKIQENRNSAYTGIESMFAPK